MRFKQVTFSIGRAMPLFPLSGDKADEYANVKPHVSCTVEFDADDPVEVSKANIALAKQVVKDALVEAQSIAFESVQQFGVEFRKLYTDRKTARKKKQS